jgi:hypothetical protein
MTPLLAFFIGLFAGVIVSVFTFSLFSASQKADDNAERAMKILEDADDEVQGDLFIERDRANAIRYTAKPTNVDEITDEKEMKP